MIVTILVLFIAAVLYDISPLLWCCRRYLGWYLSKYLFTVWLLVTVSQGRTLQAADAELWEAFGLSDRWGHCFPLIPCDIFLLVTWWHSIWVNTSEIFGPTELWNPEVRDILLEKLGEHWFSTTVISFFLLTQQLGPFINFMNLPIFFFSNWLSFVPESTILVCMFLEVEWTISFAKFLWYQFHIIIFWRVLLDTFQFLWHSFLD